MFGKINFRVLIQHIDEAVLSMTDLLREEGFKVYDLRESDIVKNSDDSKISSVYVLCCQGKEVEYKRFKEKNKYKEIIYEGHKTLM
jgi:hypothetical protein